MGKARHVFKDWVPEHLLVDTQNGGLDHMEPVGALGGLELDKTVNSRF